MKIPQIFDLNKELPEVASAEELETIKTLDEICQKIAQVISIDAQFPEEYTHTVLQLKDQVTSSVRASVVLGHAFFLLNEYSAMNDLYEELIKIHGESHILLFYLAFSKEKLNDPQKALEIYKKIIGSGCKNFHVYMQAAKIYRKEELYTESIAMANLAVYENEHDSIEPFVVMAHNFLDSEEINRMFECFSRIEKIAGKEVLQNIGEIFDDHKDVYNNVKKMIK